jgi:hypothetical protein
MEFESGRVELDFSVMTQSGEAISLTGFSHSEVPFLIMRHAPALIAVSSQTQIAVAWKPSNHRDEPR